MKKQEKIFREVKRVTQELIRCGLAEEHNFNVKLPDGGLLQLMYRLDRRGTNLQAHRLAFYPSPSYEIYQNDAELYDDDCLYGDILNKSVLPVMIRADYNSSETESEVHHPYSHITLGGYKNCRIPADRPIAPIQFVKFIMEHFYYEPSSKLKFNFALESMITFEEHIAECDVIKSRVMV
ncbi:MAG TPA: DUF2290 domain-containing protein [Candidatus Choladousia intestinipullorum]|nr:DUF2290 domain-containing protein [Candidatus Choladousia intestinipullorum]